MSSSRFVLKFWLHIDLCRVIFYCTVSFKGPLHCLEISVCTYLTRKLFSCVSACYSNLQVIGIARSVFETRPKHAMVRSSSYGRFSLPRFRNLAPNLPSFRILSLWAKLTLFSSRRNRCGSSPWTGPCFPHYARSRGYRGVVHGLKPSAWYTAFCSALRTSQVFFKARCPPCFRYIALQMPPPSMWDSHVVSHTYV